MQEEVMIMRNVLLHVAVVRLNSGYLRYVFIGL